MRKAVCTIISKNYLPAARVLMQGIARHAPDADRVVLLVDRVDGCFEPARESFRVLLSSELEIPDSRWFHFRYAILELNTAMKPFLIERLMREGYEAVVYLDPDIMVHSPLDELWKGLEENNAVLTPHLDQPVEDDRFPSEIDILRTGAYNLGFIAMRRSEETLGFLRWWEKRMERHCVVDLPGGLFVDQKWMDLLPGFLEPALVLRHPGYNVAYWNIHGRLVERKGDQYTVNGEPLRFFHFSGFHPRHPERFSRHQNRFELSDLPAAAQQVCHEYARGLVEAGFDECSKWPYAYGSFEDGKPIVDTGRRIWWEMPGLRKELADPFSVEGSARIRAAWNEMIPDLAGFWSGYTRLGWWLYEARPDVKAIMPDPFGRDRMRVLHWLVEGMRLEWSIPDEYFVSMRASLKSFIGFPDGKMPMELKRQLTWSKLGSLPPVVRRIYDSRSDLKRPFPDPAGKDRVPFLLWLLTYGRMEHYLSEETVSALKLEWKDSLAAVPPAQALALRAKYAAVRALMAARAWRRSALQGDTPEQLLLQPLPDRQLEKAGPLVGVNLVGYARAEMGVGESVRAAARAAKAAELQTALYGVDAHPKYRASDRSAGELSMSLPFPVTILHINADQTPIVTTQLGSRLSFTRYKIGFWAWELAEFPDRWLDSFEHVDEVWAPSDFCRTAIANSTTKPVLRIPHAIEPLGEAKFSREALGVPPAAFTVLFAYDAMSIVERKNPLAAVEAFRRAFTGTPDARMVLKVSHAEAAPQTMKALRAAAADPQITVIDRVMDREEVHSLIAHCDCLLSLHRSEGFGLTLAEAMSIGKTVVCTGYSGNMDFTLPGSALPVEYRLVSVGEGNEPYDAGAQWAEPNLDHAVGMLRQAYVDPSLRKRLGEEARRRILRDFSVHSVGRMMRRRLEFIHRHLDSGH